MDAFIEIIEKLVESVPGQTWLEQNHFPFKNLQSPQARVFDVCLFESNAQGAYGFLWIAFEDVHDILIFPFNLARHREDGDLISLAPWSLRSATFDNKFYLAWRHAQKLRNPLVTAKKGNLIHRKYDGEPSFIATSIRSDGRNTCVRLDFQVAYKIFRTLEKDYPQSLEVEFLTYLGTQSIFKNFAKLTNVFEYNSKMIPKAHVAIGMKYIPNNGMLFPRFVSLLRKARFPQRFKERTSQKAWEDLLSLTESIGRLLGRFHNAMALAPRHSELAPEQSTPVLKEQWFQAVCAKMDERLKNVLSHQQFHPNFSGTFYLLPDYINKIKDNVRSLDDIGLRIRSHGNIHLGQILLGVDEEVLLDYDGDDFDEPSYRRLKQPCLNDLVSMVISLRFAWHFTERKYYEQLAENTMLLEHPPLLTKQKQHSPIIERARPTLHELESVLIKYYKNSLEETISSMQLRPQNPAKEKTLFNFCFILRILKEISRETPEGNPRPRLWLHILQEFIIQENTL